MYRLSIVLFVFMQMSPSHALSSNQLQGFCKQPLQDEDVFEDLQAKIDQCHLKSVDEVIPLLSVAHRSNYALMHHSQSLQEASFQFPRAILYGKNAKLVIAFNGEKKQSRFNHLEILQFRESTRRFEARDIAFTGKKVEYSEANPTLCLSCHQEDPRPNWESYPLWPGAYGSEDDALFRPESSAIHTTAEGKAYLKFLGSQAKGRYRFLSKSPQARLPNTEFGSLLQKLNHRRIADKVKKEPKLWPFRYAVLGASACFYSSLRVQQFIPAAVSAHYTLPLLAISNETAKMNQSEFLARIDLLKEVDAGAPEDARVKEILQIMQEPVGMGGVSDQIVSEIRWVIENQGLKIEDWGLQPANPPLDFENGYIGIADLRVALSQELLAEVSEQALTEVLQRKLISDSDLEQVCQVLKAKSLMALQISKITP